MRFVSRNNLLRKKSLFANGRALPLPIFFPSISSIKTNLSPFQYVEFLTSIGQPNFLLSAYDIYHSPEKVAMIELLKDNRKNGKSVLLDSGNYESFWLKDYGWSESAFHEILKNDISDYSFIYDNQSPPLDIVQNAAAIAESVTRSRAHTTASTIVPIIHCAKAVLSETVLTVNKQSNLPIVGIPERILGDGLIERIKNLTEIRRSINANTGEYVLIHLLGTGNPISLLLFSLAGADSFDGLEWCQTVVNVENKLLYHFQQRELVEDACFFCKDSETGYYAATLGHNLLFYSKWMKQIQDAIEYETYEDLLTATVGSDVIASLRQIWN